MKLSKKSKVLALTLSASMLISAFTFSVSAATITLGSVTKVDNSGVITVTVPYTTDADATITQTTILATTGTTSGDITYGTDLTTPTNVLFIDQEARDGQFVFSFDKTKVAAGQKVFVKVGGTTVATPASTDFTLDVPPVGPVIDTTLTTFLGNQDTFLAVKGAGYRRLTLVLDAAESANALNLKPVYKAGTADETQLYYSAERSAYKGKPVYDGIIKYTGTDASAVLSNITFVSGALTATDKIMFYGDVSADDGALSLADIAQVKRVLAGLSTTLTDKQLLKADINGDNAFSVVDLVAAKRAGAGLSYQPNITITTK